MGRTPEQRLRDQEREAAAEAEANARKQRYLDKRKAFEERLLPAAVSLFGVDPLEIETRQRTLADFDREEREGRLKDAKLIDIGLPTPIVDRQIEKPRRAVVSTEPAEALPVSAGTSSEAPDRDHQFWRDRVTGVWTITLPSSGSSQRVQQQDSVGLAYLHAVIAAADEGLDAQGIQAAAGALRGDHDPGMDRKRALLSTTKDDELYSTSRPTPQYALDRPAIADIQGEIERLRSAARAVAASDELGKQDRLQEISDQIEDLNAAQRKATRPYRQARELPSDFSRAATAVGKGINRALKAISEIDPKLGTFLRNRVRPERGTWRFLGQASGWLLYPPNKPTA
jgi:hypothetical protein